MPSLTTLTLGSTAPGARTRPAHPTPVPLSPWPVYCKQGEVATLTSCTPPWMHLGVTYLRPRLAPPQPPVVRAPIPWLMILSVAAIAALVTVAAAHLLHHAATVQTVDSALATHATELARPLTRNAGVSQPGPSPERRGRPPATPWPGSPLSDSVQPH